MTKCKGKFIRLLTTISSANKVLKEGSIVELTADDSETGESIHLDCGSMQAVLKKGTDCVLIKLLEIGKFYLNPVGEPFYVCGKVRTERLGQVIVVETARGLLSLPLSASAEQCTEVDKSIFWNSIYNLRTVVGAEANGVGQTSPVVARDSNNDTGSQV